MGVLGGLGHLICLSLALPSTYGPRPWASIASHLQNRVAKSLMPPWHFHRFPA
ncbi:hypothetical protein Z947_3179 [Sulfitobacter geojensis]|nr:hypothetical protein Z947_3179 [Sulfitobacter geojensis]